jgi:hypothetical protein
VNDLADGRGKLTHTNGDVYEGEFRKGLSHGSGTYTDSNGNKYVGSWQNDEKFGEGTETNENGAVKCVYKTQYGNVSNGILTFKDGSTYEG